MEARWIYEEINIENISELVFTLYNHGLSQASVDVTGFEIITNEAVLIDIKPGSCPNPLNVKSKGKLPVAIMGSEELDVSQIDVASIRLEGVAALRSSIEDVGSPYDAPDCYYHGPDAYDDLTLKFDTQEIVGALGDVNDGDNITLKLTGELNDGTQIEGEDVVIIKKKGKK